MKELSLVYVKPIGKDTNNVYEYEFFFSETPEIVWAEDWNVQCPSACGDITPDNATYSEIKHLKTDILLSCAQENSCFSMQDVIDNILALCWQNINDLQDYPDIRPVFKYAETYENVNKILEKLDLQFEEDKPGYTPPEDEETTDDDEENWFGKDNEPDF